MSVTVAVIRIRCRESTTEPHPDVHERQQCVRAVLPILFAIQGSAPNLRRARQILKIDGAGGCLAKNEITIHHH
ncbi:MAG UNVERIFIED_CONTAM: hypothetical protein LVR18_03950 [Planctomycetaceae bacterium]